MILESLVAESEDYICIYRIILSGWVNITYGNIPHHADERSQITSIPSLDAHF